MTGVDYTIGYFDKGTGKFIKEQDWQGFFYKDTKSFKEKSNVVCYIPETSDDHYSYTDFLRIARGNHNLATVLFEIVDWQSPEILFNDMVDSGEIDESGKFLKWLEGNN
jgi:hypothetical protein